jgi:hypothetical protein
LEKLDRLVEKAKSILVESSNPGRLPLWRAYVALEYAILDLKLRYGLEGILLLSLSSHQTSLL